MWIIRGLKKGVITSPFPNKSDATIPLSLYPENTDKCVISEEMSRFGCLGCGLCNANMKRLENAIEIDKPLRFPVKKSLHIFFLDVGTCGACNREISLLKAPQYDLHRLGMFFTPTPKHADVMLVAGELTEEMIPVLKEAYELMPKPNGVIAVGSCASNDTAYRKIGEIVPLNGRIGGCPPQPLSILKALLVFAGRWEP